MFGAGGRPGVARVFIGLFSGVLCVATPGLRAQFEYAPPAVEPASGVLATPPAKGPLAHERVHEMARRFRARHGDGCEVIFLRGRGYPSIVRGFRERVALRDELPVATDPALSAHEREAFGAALSFLGQERELFGIDDPGALTLELVHGDEGSPTVVKLRQTHRGAAVLGAGATVFRDADGVVTGAIQGLLRDVAPVNLALLDGPAAGRAAHARLARDPTAPPAAPAESALAVLRRGGVDRWVVDVSLRVDGIPVRALVDAETGEVITFGSLLRAGGCRPAPRGDMYPVSPAHGAPARLELDDLDCRATQLSGDFVRSFQWIGADPWTGAPRFRFGLEGTLSQSGVVFPADAESELAQVTVYQHATAFHDWFGDVGFSALDRPLPAVSNAVECYGYFPCENAFFDPLYNYATGPGLLLFGFGFDVNFGLEADVICHEYTHAVVQETAALGEDFWDPNAFYSFALNEAFADYFSCTYLGDPDLGEYSGASFGTVPLRTLDNTYRWPDDIDPVFYHDTGQIWGGALWDVRQALSRGGLDAADVRRVDRLALSTLASLPSNADFLLAAGAFLAAAEAGDTSPAERVTIAEILAERGLTFRDGEVPSTVERVEFGQPVVGEVAAARDDEGRLGSVQYELVVPDEGAEITVTLRGDADVDLYLRHNAPVVASGQGFLHTARSVGGGTDEAVTLSVDADPRLVPGSWFVAVVERSGSVARYALETSIEVRQIDRVVALPDGEVVASSASAGAFSAEQFRFDVARSSARRLLVELDGVEDVDLWVRAGSPVELGAEGQVIADASVRTSATREVIALDELTLPVLVMGSYFFAVRNAGAVETTFTLRATLEDAPSVNLDEASLGSGDSAQGTVDGTSAGTRRLHGRQYVLRVPEDAARVVVSATSAADISLHARRGERVVPGASVALADHFAGVPGSGDETLVIDVLSEPALAAGVYYVAVSRRGADPADFSLSVEIATEVFEGEIRTLPSGAWQTVQVPGGAAGELSLTQYRMAVGAGVTGLDILTNPLTSGDIDLYVRKGRPVQILDGEVVASWRAETDRGAESITIFADELTPESYYLGVVNRSGSSVRADLLAVYDGGIPLSAPVGDGDGYEGTIGAAPAPPTGCTLTLDQFVVDVPANALRLEIDVTPLTQGTLQVLERFGSRILIDLGPAVFDVEHSTADGTIVIEGEDLRPGLWYFAVTNCEGREHRYLFEGRMTISGGAEAVLENGVIEFGVAESSPVGVDRLARTQYRFTLPAGFDELTISAWGGECSDVDLDVLVSHGQRVEVDGGGTNASWVSEVRAPGSETIVISPSSNPPIRSGTYWIALLNREGEAVPVRVGAAAWPGRTEGASPDDPALGTVGAAIGGGVFHLTQYRVDVPPGSESVRTELRARGNPDLDIDLHSRFGLPVIIDEQGFLVTEMSSESFTGVETLTYPTGGDCLRPGPYFFAVTSFAPVDVTFDVTPVITGTACVPIRLGRIVRDTARGAAAGAPALLEQYCLAVGATDPGFQVDLIGEGGASADLDLYLRRGSPVAEAGGRVTADFAAARAGEVVESLSVPSSMLVGGSEYFIAIAPRGSDPVPFELRVRPLEERARVLEVGDARDVAAPPSSADGIGWLAPEQFSIDVAAADLPLTVSLDAAAGSRLGLHVRRGDRVVVEGADVMADVSDVSDGATRAVTLDEALGSGTYWVAVRNRSARSEVARLAIGGGGAPLIVRGDADESGGVDLTDAISTLNHLFRAPVDNLCAAAADTDGSGGLSLTDPIVLLTHLFLGGRPPVDPFPGCGEAPGEDLAGCSGAACP